jgi:hypothetical protein
MATASGAQTERRGVPRPVRLPRGGEDAPAEFVSSLPLFRVLVWLGFQSSAKLQIVFRPTARR